MPKYRTGISSVGGKFRSVGRLKEYTPYHEFFLSMFSGACWFEMNKPRVRYECFNDLDAEIINYLLMTRQYPDEFDAMKQGVMGLVSQEICNRIVRGEMKPRDNLERAYFFYYLNKLTFGGDVKKIGGTPNGNDGKAHYASINNSKVLDPYTSNKRDVEKIKEEMDDNVHAHYGGIMRPTDPCRQPQIEKIKKEYQTKGYSGIINTRAIPQHTLHDKDFEDIKSEWKTKGYIGLIDNQTMSRDGYGRVDSKVVEKAKASYRGISSKVEIESEKSKASYRGINLPTSCKKESGIKEGKEQYQAVSYKGINPKTTRPYQNNDCGLLTPLDRDALLRLRYVNITCYDFRRVYKLFHSAFHVRKGLSRECFIYADPPYVGVERYYGDKFKPKDHKDLINIMLKTPFNFMLSIGGNCEEIYIEPLKNNGWIIKEVYVRYSTDAKTQKKSKEYIVMNYEINKSAKMSEDYQSNITKFFK